MAQSDDVGIAIGRGRTAIETVAIDLMNSNLTDVVLAIDLSRKVFARINFGHWDITPWQYLSLLASFILGFRWLYHHSWLLSQ